MDVVLWMLFGAISAWIAGIMVGYKSIIQCVGAGIVGAIVAGLAMQNLVGKPQDGIGYFSLIVSVAGALILTGLTIFLSVQERQ